MLLAQRKSCDLSCDQRFKADAKPSRVFTAVFFLFLNSQMSSVGCLDTCGCQRGGELRELLTPGADRALHGAWSGTRM